MENNMNKIQDKSDVSGSSEYRTSLFLAVSLYQAVHLLVCFYSISYFKRNF